MLAAYCYRLTITEEWKIDPWYKVLSIFIQKRKYAIFNVARGLYIFRADAFFARILLSA